jgi:hypothetical protein
MKTTIRYLSVFIIFSFSVCSYAQDTVGKNQLLTLDSKKLGSENMEIIIKETQFSDNIAQIEETVYKRGSVAGAIMFSMCSFTIFAKKRGYSHYVILEHSGDPYCKDCVRTFISKVGYLKNVKPCYVKSLGNMDETSVSSKDDIKKFLSEQFPQYEFKNSQQLDIIAVSDFMLVCKDLENICSW